MVEKRKSEKQTNIYVVMNDIIIIENIQKKSIF